MMMMMKTSMMMVAMGASGALSVNVASDKNQASGPTTKSGGSVKKMLATAALIVGSSCVDSVEGMCTSYNCVRECRESMAEDIFGYLRYPLWYKYMSDQGWTGFGVNNVDGTACEPIFHTRDDPNTVEQPLCRARPCGSNDCLDRPTCRRDDKMHNFTYLQAADCYHNMKHIRPGAREEEQANMKASPCNKIFTNYVTNCCFPGGCGPGTGPGSANC